MFKKIFFSFFSLIVIHQSVFSAAAEKPLEKINKALSAAIVLGRLENIQPLIESRADVNFIDERGGSPLTIAAGNLSALGLLCQNGYYRKDRHELERGEKEFLSIAALLIKAGAHCGYKDPYYNNKTAQEILENKKFYNATVFLKTMRLKQELNGIFNEPALLDYMGEFLYDLEIDGQLLELNGDYPEYIAPLVALLNIQQENKCCRIS